MSLDQRYLSLQFSERVNRMNGSEYQSLFESVMQLKYPEDFVPIAPLGRRGDGGNDGYRPEKGIYYQVYAPVKPVARGKAAAEKFRDNFYTLKKNWDKISAVKQYLFTINDKYSDIELEETKSELSQDNPGITFDTFRTADLEQVFLSLGEEKVLSLGFDVDSRNVIKTVRKYLDVLDVELDKGNAFYVEKTLENIKEIVSEQGEESLVLDYEIIEARTLQRLERIPDARKKYESIFSRYPRDVRAPLFLAEIYLNSERFGDNLELLNKAESINKESWLLRLEKLIREFRTTESPYVPAFDEQTLPADSRAKADFYRIYSLFFHRANQEERANSLIARALHLNPKKFANQEISLAFEIENASPLLNEHMVLAPENAASLISKIDELEGKFDEPGGITPRYQILLDTKRGHIYQALIDHTAYAEAAQRIFNNALKCYFDVGIDAALTGILRFTELPETDLGRLLDYVRTVEKPISNALAQALFLQFVHKESYKTDGAAFFAEIGRDDYVEFVKAILEKDYERVLKFIGTDLNFGVALSVSIKSLPELRTRIIESLPDDGTVKKEKLKLLVDYDEGDYDEAFKLLQKMDLSKLHYVECRPTLEVAKKKEAWDFVVAIITKLLEFERNEGVILQMKLELFNANLRLERYPELIAIGEGILSSANELSKLDENNQEVLTAHTAEAWIKRGRFPDALKFVEKYGQHLKSFGPKAFIVAEIYIKNSEPEKALDAVVDAVITLKRPNTEEYASLFLIFSQIGNLMDFPLESIETVVPDSFVKIKGKEVWMYVGNDVELDATRVPQHNHKHYLGKKVGDDVAVESKYRSGKNELVIEQILPIEKYILAQSLKHAQQLSLDGWDAMESIEVPTTEEGIDPKYLIAKMEDIENRGKDFFETYCKENLPLAFLALSQGGLPHAIGKITNEQRGFIKFSAGTSVEMEQQKVVAREIIAGQAFYLDGTSALVLSETGLLAKIQSHLPQLKVPQAVINMLLQIADRFTPTPGQAGQMRYVKGKIVYDPIDESRQERVRTNFQQSIEILESVPDRISVISAANKSSELTEQDIPASLCDATILAKKESILVLTEDFLYLQANEMQTKDKAPRYCSAFAIVRVLYEQGKIPFSEYLNFFAYLSGYRFRFLPVSVDDMEKAIFGGGAIQTPAPQELRKFNLKLTLSKEYGVSFKTAASLAIKLLVKLLEDDTTPPNIVDESFIELVTNFPESEEIPNKRAFAMSLLNAAVHVINERSKSFVMGTKIQEKIDVLSSSVTTFDSGVTIIRS